MGATSTRSRARQSIGAVGLAVALAALSGCVDADRVDDLAAVKREPLARSSLLNMETTNYVETVGNAMDDSSVSRHFRSDDLSGRRLLAAIREVGLDSGWTTWECEKVGDAWLLRMGKGNPGFYADIQVDHGSAVVEVGKNRPGTHSFVPEQPEVVQYPC